MSKHDLEFLDQLFAQYDKHEADRNQRMKKFNEEMERRLNQIGEAHADATAK